MGRRGNHAFDRRPQVRAVDLGGRVPPHNGEAEAAVLSAILADGRALDTVLGVVGPEAFYSDANRRIFEAAVDLHQKGTPVDIATVGGWLKDRDRLQAIGGVSYLSSILDATPSVAHVGAHAAIVAEKARVRRLIETCQMVAAEGFGDYGDAQAFVDDAERRIFAIAHDGGEKRSDVLLYDLVVESGNRLDSDLQRLQDGKRIVDGIPTGLADLDAQTSGMHGGELIIVAARPGMGKSSYALDIARNVASRVPEDDPGDCLFGVMIFSLEMPRDQLTDRMLSQAGKVNSENMRTRRFTAGEHGSLVRAMNDIAALPIWIDDTPNVSVFDIRAKARRRAAEFEQRRPDGTIARRLGLIVIDYLQLMRGEGDSREQEVASITRALKQLAKELNVPIIALAQLSRKVEERGKDKRPMLSDLRESGAIEQDADVVQFLFRPFYYLPPDEQASPQGQKIKTYAEVIVAKQRNGPTGRVKVTFLEECTRFENRAHGAASDDGDDVPAERRRSSSTRWSGRRDAPQPPPAYHAPPP